VDEAVAVAVEDADGEFGYRADHPFIQGLTAETLWAVETDVPERDIDGLTVPMPLIGSQARREAFCVTSVSVVHSSPKSTMPLTAGRARGRAPRAARNGRARGSRRITTSSSGGGGDPPGEAEDDGEAPSSVTPLAAPFRTSDGIPINGAMRRFLGERGLL
jgi:hypothetical protein